ncbi:pilus assembly protein PilN [Cellvibrio zantedeschiae]|uniref:Pilus assembly protein PilN n=1 Tax=Cellvibrio zantedeschiae TaxID=1237077 RepID=A0ABQ3B583_9GAMM|nr:PilN domain-containing protein [Cellvibrio zantedeschiae]GGY78754.1 pilus assembly protein PilN [Cellvibrio zantedeschiae]
MAKINLLPWREAYRKEKKEQFLAVIGGVVLMSGLIAYLWISSVESSIENQQARNHLLDTEIAALEKQVKEIANLKKVRDDLLARIKIIQDLQGTRPLIVRYFDDFARSIPDGVFITTMSKQGATVSIEGVAESYNRVATFMRNLDTSDWFAGANLTSVIAAPSEGEQAQSFKITVSTSVPSEAESPDAKNEKTQPSQAKKAGSK